MVIKRAQISQIQPRLMVIKRAQISPKFHKYNLVYKNESFLLQIILKFVHP